jgi:hypothetical protein
VAAAIGGAKKTLCLIIQTPINTHIMRTASVNPPTLFHVNLLFCAMSVVIGVALAHIALL